MIDRRTLGLGLAGLAAGCATRAPVLVNLALQLRPDDGARLASGADLSGRMTAPVRLNGQGPFDFVVDTGANRTVLSSELAQQLGLPSGGPASVHGIAGVEPSETALVDVLQIDAVASRRLRTPTMPRARLGAAGLLGVDVLRDRRVLLDFRTAEFRIAPSGAREPTSFSMRAATVGRTALGAGVAVRARYRFGQLIIVGADVAGKPVTAFLDSGAQATVGNMPLRRLVLGSPPDLKLVRYVTQILSATGQVAEGDVALMRLLKIGGLRIAGLETVFAPLHVFDIWGLAETPSLLLGMDVMSQFDAIELDYGRRLVTFYPRVALRN